MIFIYLCIYLAATFSTGKLRDDSSGASWLYYNLILQPLLAQKVAVWASSALYIIYILGIY